MPFVDKLTAAAERLAHSIPVAPVIIKAKPGRFDDVLHAIRGIAAEGRFLLRGELEIFPKLRTIPTFNLIAALLPREWIFDLGEAREVERVFPNKIVHICGYPTVPPEGVFEYERGAFREPRQFTTTYWTKRVIGADVANRKGYDGTGVKVAVIDTGVSLTHPATRHMRLDSVMLQVHDENGHGEHCCATVGGKRVRDERLSRKIGRDVWTEGMAPNAIVTGIKALGWVIGTGSTDGILKAVELGFSKYRADIISMSLGSPSTEERPEDDPFYEPMKELTERGVIVCCAAGNEGPGSNTISSPGAMPDVLTVGAYDPITGKVASFSSRGPTNWNDIKPDCIMPGVWIHAPVVGVLDKAGDNTKQRFSPLSGTCLAGDVDLGGYMIKEAMLGDTVMAFTPSGFVEDIVIAHWFRGENDVYEIELEDGTTIQATPEHKFLVKRGDKFVWVRADMLRENDEVVTWLDV
ncbi:MAG TPA: hypothetical protein ENG51_00470 [Deltaproteobacteria bacterium]|nr:hypothetical protein [Deltaproteobacteria bacterium]